MNESLAIMHHGNKGHNALKHHAALTGLIKQPFCCTEGLSGRLAVPVDEINSCVCHVTHVGSQGGTGYCYPCE